MALAGKILPILPILPILQLVNSAVNHVTLANSTAKGATDCFLL